MDETAITEAKHTNDYPMLNKATRFTPTSARMAQHLSACARARGALVLRCSLARRLLELSDADASTLVSHVPLRLVRDFLSRLDAAQRQWDAELDQIMSKLPADEMARLLSTLPADHDDIDDE